jgi:hypothetical protein
MKTQLQQAFATMPNPNSSQVKQTIAFFGATGGTAGSALAHALNDGNPCTARTYIPYTSLQRKTI